MKTESCRTTIIQEQVIGDAMSEAGLPVGFSAICPICKKENKARYSGLKLEWWPSAKSGEWCEHYHGAYEGGNRTVVFIFRK